MLGVIGLVIGGIWLAASEVNRNFKATETAKGLLAIASALDQALNAADIVAISGGTASYNLLTYAKNSGIVPGSWLRNGSVISPMGHDTYINVATNSATNPRLDIGFSSVAPRDCADLLYKVAPKINSPNSPLMGIYLNSAWVNIPIDPAQVATLCDTTKTILFVGRV